jgi:hypothetical protein
MLTRKKVEKPTISLIEKLAIKEATTNYAKTIR